MTRQAAAQDDVATRLLGLSEDLAQEGLEVELCLVGGAVIVVPFNARPETRRVTALFRPARLVREAAERVAERLGLTSDWMNDAARRYVPQSGLSAPFFDESSLRVFSARGDYVLAMKCASIPFESDPDEIKRIEADLRYLLRYLDINRVGDAMRLLSDYLPIRYLPDDFEDRVDNLLGT